MSATEKAWSWCERRGWHPYAEDSDDSDLNNVRKSLRRLQQMRLPLDAISEIEVLLLHHHEYLMKDSGRRKVGQVPTHRVPELQGYGHEAGYEYECDLVPDNHRHSVVYAFSDLAEEWFRGWVAAKQAFLVQLTNMLTGLPVERFPMSKTPPPATPVEPLVMRPDRCEKCRQYKYGFCDLTGETTKPDWSCEDFMGHICMECGWDIRTHEVLRRLYDKMCPTDSICGSDFQTCRMCHTGGSPTRPWKHADNCEMKEVEEWLFGLGEFEA